MKLVTSNTPAINWDTQLIIFLESFLATYVFQIYMEEKELG